MKWRNDLYSEALYVESRWARWWRQLKRLTVALLLLVLVAFLTLHPTGQALVATGKSVGQMIWQWAERQGVQTFGPEPLLRRRAQWAIADLAAEQEQLQHLAQAATEALDKIAQELPALQAAEKAAIAAMHRQPATLAANWGASLLTYSDWQEQVADRQQARRVQAAVLVQAQALQQEAHQQQGALETTLVFFAQWQKQTGDQVGSGLRDGEQAALRSALQRQIARAHAISAARRALEAAVQTVTPPTQPTTPEENPSLAQGK